VEVVYLHPENVVSDYKQAVALAGREAEQRFEDFMLLSRYDRDRDFESPPHTFECAQGCKKDGYIRYGLNHRAKLMIDIEDGRFVSFYVPVEWGE
jgi:hypothetical protein